MEDLDNTSWLKKQVVTKDQPIELKYLAGEKITFYMGENMKAFNFSPVGKLPERFARHLLKKYPKDFEIYSPTQSYSIASVSSGTIQVQKEEQKPEPPKEEKPKLVCDICGKEVKTNAALGAHKKIKHKENNK